MKSQSRIVKWGLALCLAVGIWGAGPARAGSSDQDERVISRAYGLFDAGKRDKAIAEITQAIATSPKSSDLYATRAILLEAEGRLIEARQDADRAYELDPEDPWNTYVRARVLLAVEEPQQALALLDPALKDYPTAGNFELRAEIFAKLGRKAEAEKDFKAAVKLASDDVDLRVGYIAFLVDEDRAEEAMTEVEAALAEAPGSKRALLWKLHIHLLLPHQTEMAGKALAQALKLYPRDADFWEAGADVWRAQGNLQTALDSLNRAIDLKPGQADLWMKRGEIRAALSDLEGALSDLTTAIKYDARNTDALLYRAVIWTFDGDLSKAEADLKLPAEERPDDSLVINTQAVIAYRQGKPDQAMALLRRAIGLEPKDLELRVNLAVLLMEAGQFAQANDEIDKAIDLDGPPAYASAIKAEILRRSRDLPAAEAMADKAIMADPKLAYGWFVRSQIRRDRGDLPGAIRDTTRATGLDEGIGSRTTASLFMTDWWAY